MKNNDTNRTFHIYIVLFLILFSTTVVFYPFHFPKSCEDIESLCFIGFPSGFVLLFSLMSAIGVFLLDSPKARPIVLPLILFSFMCTFISRIPYPRGEELFSIGDILYLQNVGHIISYNNPIAWEGAGYPGFFIFSDIFRSLSGVGLYHTFYLIRLYLPLVVSLLIGALFKRVFQVSWSQFTLLAIVSSYGLSDLFSFTPLYYASALLFLLILLLNFEAIHGITQNRSSLIAIVLAVFAALFSHPFSGIAVVTLTASAAIVLKNGGNRLRKTIYLPLLGAGIDIAYNLYYVPNFGSYLISGLVQFNGVLMSGLLGPADRNAIQSHVNVFPIWSTATVLLWTALTVTGLFVSVWHWLKKKGAFPFAVLLGLTFYLIIEGASQSGGSSGVESGILSWLSFMAVPLSVKSFTRFKFFGQNRQRILRLATVGVMGLLVTSSMLTYASAFYVQSANNKDMNAVSYSNQFITSRITVFVNYPNYFELFNDTKATYTSTNSSQTLVENFVSSSNSVLYVDIIKSTTSAELYGNTSPNITVSTYQSATKSSNLIYSAADCCYIYYRD